MYILIETELFSNKHIHILTRVRMYGESSQVMELDDLSSDADDVFEKMLNGSSSKVLGWFALRDWYAKYLIEEGFTSGGGKNGLDLRSEPVGDHVKVFDFTELEALVYHCHYMTRAVTRAAHVRVGHG